jgi:hypothetical protein
LAILDQLISKLPLGLAEDTQLRGDLLEEGTDQLLALGEHPRVELKDRSGRWKGQLFDDQVQQRRLADALRASQSEHKSLRGGSRPYCSCDLVGEGSAVKAILRS